MELIQKLYCVYKHTNLQNGKVYYGIAQNPVQRWNGGFGYTSNLLFWKDIIAYGWRNFKHEIVTCKLEKQNALWLEGLLIQESQSFLEENGYNQNYQTVNFEEICVDSTIEQDDENKRKERRGRNGQPVVYLEKFYPNIKTFCAEMDEDDIVVSQGLNPNCSRKLPKHLLENGLRYATDTEIEQNS